MLLAAECKLASERVEVAEAPRLGATGVREQCVTTYSLAVSASVARKLASLRLRPVLVSVYASPAVSQNSTLRV